VKIKEFNNKVSTHQQPIVVDLWAPWCTPCKAMAPSVTQISQKYKGKVDVLKINVDESPEVMKELGVMSIPTMIAFAKGSEVMRRTGMQTIGMLDFFFNAAYNEKKPDIMPPAPLARIVRTILGLGVLVLGWFFDRSILIMFLGGSLLFSAFYDRCPIFRAIFPKIKRLFIKQV
jgi:thioredoxin